MIEIVEGRLSCFLGTGRLSPDEEQGHHWPGPAGKADCEASPYNFTSKLHHQRPITASTVWAFWKLISDIKSNPQLAGRHLIYCTGDEDSPHASSDGDGHDCGGDTCGDATAVFLLSAGIMLEGEMSTDEAAAKLERVMLEKGISSSSIVGHDLPVLTTLRALARAQHLGWIAKGDEHAHCGNEMICTASSASQNSSSCSAWCMSRIVPGRISLLEFGDGEGSGLKVTDLKEMCRVLQHETVSCIYKLDPASLTASRILKQAQIQTYDRNLESASTCAECIEAVRKFFTVCDLEKGHVLIQCSRSRGRPSSAASDLQRGEAGQGKGVEEEGGEEEEEEGEAQDELIVQGATLAAMYMCRHHGLEPEEAAAWVQLCCGSPRLAANFSDCSPSHSAHLGPISIDNEAAAIFCWGVEYSPNNTPLIGGAGLERLANALSENKSTRRRSELSPSCSARRDSFPRTDKSPPFFLLGAQYRSGSRSGSSTRSGSISSMGAEPAEGRVASTWSAYSALETVDTTTERAEVETREAPSLETHKFEHLLKFRLVNKMSASFSEGSNQRSRGIVPKTRGGSSSNLRESMGMKAMINSGIKPSSSFDFNFIQRASSNWEDLYDEQDDFEIGDGVKLSRTGSLVGIGYANNVAAVGKTSAEPKLNGRTSPNRDLQVLSRTLSRASSSGISRSSSVDSSLCCMDDSVLNSSRNSESGSKSSPWLSRSNMGGSFKHERRHSNCSLSSS